MLKGDPDIAGTGVVSAVWAANAASIITGGTLWWLTTIKGKLPSNDKTCERVLRCAFALSDTAFITMLAVISSSIVLIKAKSDTSLYHVFIARCLAQNCQTGLFCSVPFYEYRTLGNRRNIGAITRVVLYIFALILWVYWTTLCMDEFRMWRPVMPSCFYNDTWIWGSYIGWMKVDLFWTPCAWIWYYLEAWQKCEALLRDTNAFVPGLSRRIQTNRKSLYDMRKSLNTSRNLVIALALWFAATCVSLIYTLADTVACLLVAFFVAPPSTAPLVNILTFVWSAYDVSTVWRSNKHLVTECPAGQYLSAQGNKNPEADWGFGQLLPMFLLLLPILTVLDSLD